jgi:uncharacterized RDD family membrane protein YckC
VDDPDDFDRDGGQDVFRMGQDFTLGAGQNADEVVVMMGNATINGHVRELVVIVGSVSLGPTAIVDRTLTAIGAEVQVAEGATVGQEVVVIGGTLEAPPGFSAGREHVIINPPLIGARLSSLVPYLTEGVMLGRPLVPRLGWVWGLLGVVFIVYLVVNLLADGPVRAAVSILDEKALTSFGTGLLVLLLFGPVSLLLAVSVVGLLVIPVLACAVLAAALVGKVATFRWLGARVWRGAEPGVAEATVTFLIGFAIVTLVYIIPVLGMVAFALLGVLSLGAACLSFLAAYRREQPPAPPAVPPLVPPVPPVMSEPSSVPLGASGGDVSTASASTIPPPVPPSSYGLAALPRGSFRDRLAAFLLDLILVALVVQVAWPFRGGRPLFLALLAYHIALWAWKHTTVGGIICQLRIVRMDGAPLTLADAFIRGLSAVFSVVVAGLGFFWVLRDPERQSWHDKIAGTYVVKVPPTWRG